MAEFNISRFKYIWKGVWASGLTFSKDDIVAVGGKAYVCLIGHIGSAISFDEDLNFVNQFNNPEPRWELLADGARWTGNWATNIKYNQNELVKYGATIYSCTIGHTSASTTVEGLATDLEKWEFVARTVQWRDQWVAARKYLLGDLISYNGLLYLCNEEHTAANIVNGLEFDQAKWTLVNDSDYWLDSWLAQTRYRKNDIVTYGGVVFRCTDGHTSGLNSLGIYGDSNYWETVYSNIEYKGDWISGTAYKINDIVKKGNSLWRATVNLGNSPSDFEETSWNLWLPGLGYENAWNSAVEYNQGDIVIYGGYSYINIIPNNQNTIPPENPAHWRILTTGYNYRDTFNLDTVYNTGDVVLYGGDLYLALENTKGTRPEHFTETVTYNVTVLETDAGNRYFLNDEETPSLTLVEGSTYIFDQTDVTNITHPIYFSTTQNGHHVSSYNYFTNGITYLIDDVEKTAEEYNTDFGTATTSRKIIITLGEIDTLQEVYIVCHNHIDMYGTSSVQLTRGNAWERLVYGQKWTNSWITDREYSRGDIAVYAGTPYICIAFHRADDSSLVRPDLDDGSFWNTLIQGCATNVLTTRGDIKTQVQGTVLGYPIGAPGNLGKVSPVLDYEWTGFEAVENVYFVATNGVDSDEAGSKAAPFRTIKAACDYIRADEITRTPATIFVSTGSFAEILPIKVPRNTAVVGDELRSTSVKPAPGYETSDMFHVRNGCGIRNMTLMGLSGTLEDPNQFFTRRPTAGAYVSLDPGEGPDDSVVWITNKSTYVQNVTTFGTGCVGLKVDGNLHNGGNKSIVANDFTQVLSDGIGVWVNGDARSELVSVFSYYGHIGYLAENGGTIRATNGNSSYGTYGCVAEGFLINEEPITANVNHRALDAQVDTVYALTDGIGAVGYTHTGQDYTEATFSISGTGVNANLKLGNRRVGCISELRLDGADDSTNSGGFGFRYDSNYAQTGGPTSITLASNYEVTADDIVGMRIQLIEGPGQGQFGYISAYDFSTRVATIQNRYGQSGWMHVMPGHPIAPIINESTRYVIEPNVDVPEPEYVFESVSHGSLKQITGVSSTDNLRIAIATGTDTVAYSENGGPWTNATLPEAGTWIDIDNDGIDFWAINSDGTVARSSNGTNWTFYNLPTASDYFKFTVAGDFYIVGRLNSGEILYTTTPGDVNSWTAVTIGTLTGVEFIEYINEKIYVANKDGEIYSSIDILDWTVESNPLTGNYKISSLASGSNVLVAAIYDTTNVSSSKYLFSLAIQDETISWNDGGNCKANEFVFQSTDEFYVSYSAGLFFAISSSGSINYSQDGYNWGVKTAVSGSYLGIQSTIHNNVNQFYILQATSTSTIPTITYGSTAVIRANITNQSIASFQILECGSNYSDSFFQQPDKEIFVFDPAKQVEVNFDIRITNNALSVPSILSRGIEYIRASGTLSGDGFADIYPLGAFVYVVNLTRIPGPGDTLKFATDDTSYSIQKIELITGVGPFSARLQVTPLIDRDVSPEHDDAINIRQRYSQIRLTGHDFLDIGTGNFNTTNYPGLYVFGYDFGEYNPKPNQEVVFNGGGRVFYTSTDQDGNFKVGELFKVEQATGVVTISATQFNLGGLEELILGGIVLGGTNAVIREFSTDPAFVANSDNIVPTQKAIRRYIDSRISSGGSNVNANTLVAGNVTVTGSSIDNRAGFPTTIKVPFKFDNGAVGEYLSLQYFARK